MNIEEKNEKDLVTDVPEEKKENGKSEKKEKKRNKNKHEEEILKLTEALAQEKEKAMRIQAEMMNFRRRKEEEVTAIHKYANEEILKKLINIIDNFERALSLENDDNKEFLKGFQMIYSNILNILSENSVVEIECLNTAFDPNFQQAVLTEKAEGVESGVVIEVLQKGYMYKDRVLRAAMVKVSE